MAEIRSDSDFWYGELEAAKRRVDVAQAMVDLISRQEPPRTMDMTTLLMADCQMGFVAEGEEDE